MTVVSSHKPSKDSIFCAINQWRANNSWTRNFDRITYFGNNEEGLNGTFVPSDQFPRIRDLVGYCATVPGWSAIVNADIVIGDDFRKVEGHLLLKKAQCSMSRRFQFEGEDLAKAALVDMGLDFFAATQETWQMILPQVPENLRIGHCLWDTWMLNFMATNYLGGFYDITECRVVFHPKHEDRKREYTIEPTDNPYFHGGRYPRLKLTL